jgi:hypothetical protein
MYDAACASASHAPVPLSFTLSTRPSLDRNDASALPCSPFDANRHFPRLEINVTRRKQTPTYVSNRNKKRDCCAPLSVIVISGFGALPFLIGTTQLLESALTPSVLTPNAFLIGTICPTFLPTSTHPPAARIRSRRSRIPISSNLAQFPGSPATAFSLSAAVLASIRTAVLLSNPEVANERQ